jgi:hypothetical protein
MRLFSEKVTPTFTSSDLNILTVEDFQEIFFDVFEFEINGKKFIAEKISEYKGYPVVDVPLVLEGRELTAPFVLQRGSFEVLFNKNNSTFVRENLEVVEEEYGNYSHPEEEVESIIFEKKEDILKEINSARLSAKKYVEKVKQEKLEEAYTAIQEKKEALKAEIEDCKNQLLEEFLELVGKVKSDISSEGTAHRDRVDIFIEKRLDVITKQLVDNINSKQEKAESKFSEQINELAANVLSGVLLKEISNKTRDIEKGVTAKFESISNSLRGLISQEVKQVEGLVKEELEENKNLVYDLQKANIELNDRINKDTNKSLSRIGNVKTQLEQSLQEVKENVKELVLDTENKIIEDVSAKIKEGDETILESCIQKIEDTENNISKFYNDRISIIQEELQNTTEQNRRNIIDLINESKESILAEVSNIKVDVPNIIIEKSNGKQEVDLKGIKSELEKIIGTRFSNELQALKRLIEMSSGGGSVAKQFAAGGTMDGSLTLVGDLIFNPGSIENVNTIQFNTALETNPNTGEIGWNSSDGTLDVGLQNNVTIPIGEKQVVYVKAAENIKVGQCVYASSASGGGSGNIIVSLFSANASFVDEYRFLGIATQDFTANDFGYVATFGKIKNVDPQYTRGTDDPQYGLPRNQGWSVGTILFISANQAGRFTSVSPTSPNRRMAVAIVIAENGNTRTLFVRSEHGYDLNDLHDVKISNPLNNQLLSFNQILSTWENTSNLNVTSLSASTIYTNNLEALSANITVIDIKQYELSGFNVQGNSTIQGNVSASGNIAASNMTINNLQVATNEIGPSLTYTSGNLTRVDYDSGNYKIFSYTDDILTQIDYVVGSTTIRKTLNYNLDGTLASVDQTTI